MLPTEIFKKIVITEKSYKLMEKQQIVFLVDLKARKSQIKHAFEIIFGYQVKNVNTFRLKAKKKRVGRFAGKTNRRKKAIITLAPGQKFDLIQNDSANQEANKISTNISQKTGFFNKFKKKIDNLTKINVDKIGEKKE